MQILLRWKRVAASLLGLGVWSDDVPFLLVVIGVCWKFVAILAFGIWESKRGRGT